MAQKRYRYKSQIVDVAAMADQVTGPPTIVAGTPCVLCVDLLVDEAYKGDLDTFMAGQKYDYVGEIPLADPPYLALQMNAVNSGVLYDVVIDDSGGTPAIVITPA